MKKYYQYIKEANEYNKKITLNNVLGENIVANIGKDLASFLKVLVISLSPLNILELGTGSGYALSVLAQSTKDYARNITTVDNDRNNQKITKQNLTGFGYENIDYVCDDIFSFLKSNNQYYDFILLDTDPSHYVEAVSLISKHQLKRSVLLVHDALIPDIEYAPKNLKQNMLEFNNYIRKSDLYSANLIPLGDGFWFCLRS